MISTPTCNCGCTHSDRAIRKIISGVDIFELHVIDIEVPVNPILSILHLVNDGGYCCICSIFRTSKTLDYWGSSRQVNPTTAIDIKFNVPNFYVRNKSLDEIIKAAISAAAVQLDLERRQAYADAGIPMVEII